MNKAKLISTFTLVTALPLSAAVTVVSGLPSGALISNPDLAASGGIDGSTAVGVPAAGDFFEKGQSFTLSGSTSITTITVRVDETTNAVGGNPLDSVGDVDLHIYNVTGTPDDVQGTGQVPTGAPILTQTETLPSTTTGDYLTFTLNSPLGLGAGVYAFTLVSRAAPNDILMRLDTNRQNAGGTNNLSYTGGEIVRRDATTWEDRNFDLVFAIEEVPEPGTSLLAGLGAFLLLRRRR